jgi:hypothetical protein
MPALVQIPIGGGLDESTDPRRGDPSRPTRLENFQFTKDGAYDMRPGYLTFANGPQKAYRLAVHKDQLLAIDGANLWSYRPNGTAAWEQLDPVSPCKVTWDPAIGVVPAVLSMDEGYGNGLLVTAFVANIHGLNGVWVRITDATTGAVIVDRSLVSPIGIAAANVKVTIIGASSNIAVVSWQQTTGDVYFARYDLTAPTSAPTTGTAATFTAASAYAVCPMVGGLGIVFVGESTVAGNTVKVQTRTTAVAGGSTANLAEAATPILAFTCRAGTLTIGVTPTSSIWIAYAFLNGITWDVICRAVNESTLVDNVAATTTLATLPVAPTRLVMAIRSATHAVVAAGNDTPVSDAYYRQVTTSAATAGPQREIRQCTPVAQPFMNGTACYLPLLFTDADAAQYTTFLVDLNITDITTVSLAVQPRATVMPRTCALINGQVSTTMSLASSRFSWLVGGDRSQLSRKSGTRVTADFLAYDNWKAARLGDHTYFSGGMPMVFDGVNLFEVGHLTYHARLSVGLTQVVGGGALGAGTYSVAIVYEQPDATGAVHRSGVAAPITVTVGANDRITYLLLPNSLTARQGVDKLPAQIIRIYRSLVNLSDLYRVGDLHPDAALYNNPTAATQTLTNEGTADATHGLNPLVYTTGGYLPNVCPPSFIDVWAHKNRIWGIAGDRRTVWFSKPFVLGEAPGFHPTLTLSVDDDGEPLSAIASLDDKLVLFKRGSVYIVVGDGPNDTGAGSDLSAPERISSDVGCIDVRSTVSTPVGLFFQSSRGIMLLTRGLEVQFVGEAVCDTCVTYPICTSAVLVASRNQVRFTMVSVDGDTAGMMLVFDYRRGRWTTFSLHGEEGDSGSEPAGVQSAAVHPSYGYCIGYSPGSVQIGTVKYESGYVDGTGGSVNTAVWESPWIVPAGLQGEFTLQDVLILGTNITDHAITLVVEYDFDSSRSLSKTWTAAELDTVGAREQLRFTPGYGWAQSVRLRITAQFDENGTTGTGQGMTLAGVTLQIEGATPGATKNLAAAAKK